MKLRYMKIDLFPLFALHFLIIPVDMLFRLAAGIYLCLRVGGTVQNRSANLWRREVGDCISGDENHFAGLGCNKIMSSLLHPCDLFSLAWLLSILVYLEVVTYPGLGF